MRKSLILIVCLVIALTACAPVKVDSAQPPPIAVYYAGAENAQMGVKAALDLRQQSGTIKLISDPAQAQTIVLNGALPSDVAAIADRMAQGAGLLLIMGKDVNADQVSALLGKPITIEAKEDALSLIAPDGSSNGVLQDIVWSSAPQVRERSIVTGLSGKPIVTELSGEPIVTGYESGEAILQTASIGKGPVYLGDGLRFGH